MHRDNKIVKRVNERLRDMGLPPIIPADEKKKSPQRRSLHTVIQGLPINFAPINNTYQSQPVTFVNTQVTGIKRPIPRKQESPKNKRAKRS